MRQVDSFYHELKEPNKSCLEALRQIIINYDTEITETVKYGMPFFCYGKKMLCYFWINKQTKIPYISFADGNQMDLPWLESGERSRMKIISIDPYEDLPVKQIRQTLRLGIGLLKKTGS